MGTGISLGEVHEGWMKKSIVLIPLPSLIKNSFVRSFTCSKESKQCPHYSAKLKYMGVFHFTSKCLQSSIVKRKKRTKQTNKCFLVGFSLHYICLCNYNSNASVALKHLPRMSLLLSVAPRDSVTRNEFQQFRTEYRTQNTYYVWGHRNLPIDCIYLQDHTYIYPI